MNKKDSEITPLDIYDGDVSCSKEDISDMLDNDMSAKDLQRLQILDEAANRKWRNPVDVDAEWEKFEAERLKTSNNQRKTTARKRRKTIPLWVLAAAVACVIVAVFLVSRNSLFTDDRVSDIQVIHYANVPKVTEEKAKKVVKTVSVGKKTMKEIAVDGKRILSMTLADGTKVWLNSNSTLRYTDDFSKTNRTVELDGEAFFDVTHDKAHPFIIKSKGVTTKVLGTKFNVRCYDANDIHVTLVEGSVEVNSPEGKVTITPDQDVSFTDNILEVQEVNTRDFTCWREGIMLFDNASLRTILKHISGWYGVNVICRDDELLNKHFHFVYNHNEPLDDAVLMLNETSNLGIVIKDSTIVIP